VDPEWTIPALREHLEATITTLKENMAMALVSADKAVSKAEDASERRFDSVNEFREDPPGGSISYQK
jgi:hypothetical protein